MTDSNKYLLKVISIWLLLIIGFGITIDLAYIYGMVGGTPQYLIQILCI